MLDHNPESSYVGFDTFNSLPNVWQGLTASTEAGTFDVGSDVDNVNIGDDLGAWLGDHIKTFMERA